MYLKSIPEGQQKNLNIVEYFHKYKNSPNGRGGQADGDDDEGQDDGCCSRSKTNSVCWCEPAQDFMPVEFCRDSSLHGLKYIGQPHRHLSERIFWFLAFVAGVTAACYLINGVWDKYKNSPVMVSFKETETTIVQIPFPAITICNVNNVLKSKAKGFIFNATNLTGTAQYLALKNLNLTDHVCTSAAQSFTQKLHYHAEGSLVPSDLLQLATTVVGQEQVSKQSSDVQDFLNDAAQKCDTMILRCFWEDQEVIDCSTKIFQPIESDFGKCCSFNLIPLSLLFVSQNDERDKESEMEKWSKTDISMDYLLLKDQDSTETVNATVMRDKRPRRLNRPGKSYGLSLLLDPELDQYFCTTADSIGFQLTTHLPIDIPHVADNGISIQPNHESFIRVIPDVTTAEDSVSDIDLDKRKCYFEGEYSLKYYKYYTSSNCYDECIANMTFAECECVRYYMPRDEDRALCGADKFGCAQNIKERLISTGFSNKCSICFPTCTEITYSTQMSVSPLRKDVDIWLYTNNETKTTESKNWTRRNLAIVHIYFAEDSLYPKIRKQLYGFTDLIANTGGLLGLCLGFSVLSLLEVIYFLTLRAWWQARFKRRALKALTHKVVEIWKKFRRRLSAKMDDGSRVLPFVSQSNFVPGWRQASERVRKNVRKGDILVGEVAPYYVNKTTFGLIRDN